MAQVQLQGLQIFSWWATGGKMASVSIQEVTLHPGPGPLDQTES